VEKLDKIPIAMLRVLGYYNNIWEGIPVCFGYLATENDKVFPEANDE